ncbi:MAG: amidinotransferase [Chloracidobacterium sp.]|nr:amidinotransferase [Chloracidobacterium sp.]
MPLARNILLIRPQNFGYNPETAKSNEFQNKAEDLDENLIKQNALAAFDQFAEALYSKGINIRVFEDTEMPQKDDAIFPNNWVSFHADGTVILYPMCAVNRRSERRMDIIETLGREFHVEKIIDLSHFEKENRFLEGTGSIVFDHANKIAYACLSARTDAGLFNKVSEILGYAPVSFHAVDADGKAIYHTNVMMCIGVGFAVVCLESIENEIKKTAIINSLKNCGLEIIDISFDQMNNFAGNMLAVSGENGKVYLVQSQSAFDSLRNDQIAVLEKYCELLPIPIPTIETLGGGSARCMMAEIFLPELNT